MFSPDHSSHRFCYTQTTDGSSVCFECEFRFLSSHSPLTFRKIQTIQKVMGFVNFDNANFVACKIVEIVSNTREISDSLAKEYLTLVDACVNASYKVFISIQLLSSIFSNALQNGINTKTMVSIIKVLSQHDEILKFMIRQTYVSNPINLTDVCSQFLYVVSSDGVRRNVLDILSLVCSRDVKLVRNVMKKNSPLGNTSNLETVLGILTESQNTDLQNSVLLFLQKIVQFEIFREMLADSHSVIDAITSVVLSHSQKTQLECLKFVYVLIDPEDSFGDSVSKKLEKKLSMSNIPDFLLEVIGGGEVQSMDNISLIFKIFEKFRSSSLTFVDHFVKVGLELFLKKLFALPSSLDLGNVQEINTQQKQAQDISPQIMEVIIEIEIFLINFLHSILDFNGTKGDLGCLTRVRKIFASHFNTCFEYFDVLISTNNHSDRFFIVNLGFITKYLSFFPTNVFSSNEMKIIISVFRKIIDKLHFIFNKNQGGVRPFVNFLNLLQEFIDVERFDENSNDIGSYQTLFDFTNVVIKELIVPVVVGYKDTSILSPVQQGNPRESLYYFFLLFMKNYFVFLTSSYTQKKGVSGSIEKEISEFLCQNRIISLLLTHLRQTENEEVNELVYFTLKHVFKHVDLLRSSEFNLINRNLSRLPLNGSLTTLLFILRENSRSTISRENQKLLIYMLYICSYFEDPLSSGPAAITNTDIVKSLEYFVVNNELNVLQVNFGNEINQIFFVFAKMKTNPSSDLMKRIQRLVSNIKEIDVTNTVVLDWLLKFPNSKSLTKGILLSLVNHNIGNREHNDEELTEENSQNDRFFNGLYDLLPRPACDFIDVMKSLFKRICSSRVKVTEANVRKLHFLILIVKRKLDHDDNQFFDNDEFWDVLNTLLLQLIVIEKNVNTKIHPSLLPLVENCIQNVCGIVIYVVTRNDRVSFTKIPEKIYHRFFGHFINMFQRFNPQKKYSSSVVSLINVFLYYFLCCGGGGAQNINSGAGTLENIVNERGNMMIGVLKIVHVKKYLEQNNDLMVSFLQLYVILYFLFDKTKNDDKKKQLINIYSVSDIMSFLSNDSNWAKNFSTLMYVLNHAHFDTTRQLFSNREILVMRFSNLLVSLDDILVENAIKSLSLLVTDNKFLFLWNDFIMSDVILPRFSSESGYEITNSTFQIVSFFMKFNLIHVDEWSKSFFRNKRVLDALFSQLHSLISSTNKKSVRGELKEKWLSFVDDNLNTMQMFLGYGLIERERFSVLKDLVTELVKVVEKNCRVDASFDEEPDVPNSSRFSKISKNVVVINKIFQGKNPERGGNEIEEIKASVKRRCESILWIMENASDTKKTK